MVFFLFTSIEKGGREMTEKWNKWENKVKWKRGERKERNLRGGIEQREVYKKVVTVMGIVGKRIIESWRGV